MTRCLHILNQAGIGFRLLTKEGGLAMKKLILRYIRYILALLANIGFGRSLN
jgi:hypothetical protein